MDQCGRPVYGGKSQVVSDGFVSIEFSPEIEEGEDYTQRNAAGDLCVSERGQDALQWISVSIEFCRVDAELWTILNPTWKVVTNAQGEVSGFRIGEKFSDTDGFALEVWPKATGQSTLCDEDSPEDAVPNGYFLLPYVLGTAPESWTLEDGVATFTLNGRTKAGSLWGRGPYNITHNRFGNPSPLLEPIDSGATSNNPEHFHADLVTLAPPEAQCGAQPLEPMAPGAIDGEVTVDTEQPNRACFTVSGSPARRVTIDWGDDSGEVNSRVGREECHLYTATGTYNITVTDIDDAEKSNSYEVEITEVPPLEDPTISVDPTSGEAPLSTTLTVNNHGNGQVTIDWGDGTPSQTGNGGDNTSPQTYPHEFTDPGTHTITVTAVEDDRASATVDVEVAAPAPATPTDVAVDADSITTSALTVNWTWSQGGGPEASGFEVRHRTPPDSGEWNSPTAVNDAAARSHEITGLDAGTEYEVQVRAITDAGGQSEWSASATATTNSAATNTARTRR